MEISNRFPFAIKVSFNKGDTYGNITVKSGSTTDVLDEPESIALEVPEHVDLEGAKSHGQKLVEKE